MIKDKSAYPDNKSVEDNNYSINNDDDEDFQDIVHTMRQSIDKALIKPDYLKKQS